MAKEIFQAPLTVVKYGDNIMHVTPRVQQVDCGFTEIRREWLSNKIQSQPGACVVPETIKRGDVVPANFPDSVETVVMHKPGMGYIWVTPASLAAFTTACAACCTN